MRLRKTRGNRAPSKGSRTPDASAGERLTELGALFERQRVELEGCVADAERRASQAHEKANERIEQQRREAEARLAEVQRRSEERIEAERRTAQERVAEAERRGREAEERAVKAEAQLKKDGLRPRAARKLAEARQKLEQERATGRRLTEDRGRLEAELRRAQEQERALRQAHAAERAELERRLKELESRVPELERTLEKERGVLASRVAEWEKLLEEAGVEHAREHNYRRALEDRLAAELHRGEEAQTQLETEIAVAKAERQRVQQLEREVREVREQASTERAERQRLEQRLETNLQNGIETRPDGEQPPSERSRGSVEAVDEAEASERSPGERSQLFEGPRRASANAFGDDTPKSERPQNGQPPSTAGETQQELRGESGRKSRRWWRRAPLPCAVCHRPRPAISDADLTASGWALKGANGLCAACQDEGWHFPADAAVPFRRADVRSRG